jgi:hypothetical protein
MESFANGLVAIKEAASLHLIVKAGLQNRLSQSFEEQKASGSSGSQ